MIEITREEKIDYIFDYIKRTERKDKINFYLKWIFRITMAAYTIYFIYFWLPKLMGSFKDIITPKIWIDNSIIESENVQKLKDKLKNILESKKEEWIY